MISKFFFSRFYIYNLIYPSKNISSLSKAKIYFPWDINTPMHLEYKVPIFLKLFIIFILKSSWLWFLIILLVLSFEKSFTKMSSNWDKFWFWIDFIEGIIVFWQLKTGIITLIFGSENLVKL